jgi:hypothetical protein
MSRRSLSTPAMLSSCPTSASARITTAHPVLLRSRSRSTRRVALGFHTLSAHRPVLTVPPRRPATRLGAVEPALASVDVPSSHALVEIRHDDELVYTRAPSQSARSEHRCHRGQQPLFVPVNGPTCPHIHAGHDSHPPNYSGSGRIFTFYSSDDSVGQINCATGNVVNSGGPLVGSSVPPKIMETRFEHRISGADSPDGDGPTIGSPGSTPSPRRVPSSDGHLSCSDSAVATHSCSNQVCEGPDAPRVPHTQSPSPFAPTPPIPLYRFLYE